MTMSAYNSAKFRWLSFVAILCVILGHSFMGHSPVVAILCQWHVPWFLFCSGMLLSLSLTYHSPMVLAQKKFWSLLVPYVLWCLVGMVLTFPHHTFAFSWLGILGLETVFPIGNLNLWYLHVLIIYTLGALMVGKLLRASSVFAIVGCVIFCVLFALSIQFRLPVVYGTPSSPFYFIGGVAASRVLLTDRRPSLGVAYAFFIVFLILFVACRWGAFVHSGGMIKHCSIVCQISCFWHGYDILEEYFSVSGYRPKCLAAVFFVYCFHGPAMLYVKDLWLLAFGDSRALLGVGSWCVWIGVVCLSFFVAAFMSRHFPKCYSFLSGGR